jgi:fluoride exporter
MQVEQFAMLYRLACLAFLGAVGTLSRYWLDMFVIHWFGSRFPWGIFAVNGLGCFLFGLVVPLAESRQLLSAETRFLLVTGFLGAFTTFSTFTFHTAEFMRESQWMLAAANVFGQLALGLICLFLGLAIGSRI